MKKFLLATSILAASAGFAAAEVKVGGSARMGLISNGTDVEFTSRVRVSFDMSGTTDGGLEFGASVRNDQSGQGNTRNGDSTVFIKGAFGKLTMGDTGNAADALVGQVSGVGLTGLGDLNEIGWLDRNNTGAMYEYSTGALTFGIGVGQTTAPAPVAPAVDVSGDNFMSIAVKYSTDAYSVALGYESNDDNSAAAGNQAESQLSLSGSATFGAATVKAKIVDRKSAAKIAAALSVDYTTGATTITAFATDNANFAGGSTYGIGASYDLGGGAKVVGGIAKAKGAKTVADIGVSMSF